MKVKVTGMLTPVKGVTPEGQRSALALISLEGTEYLVVDHGRGSDLWDLPYEQVAVMGEARTVKGSRILEVQAFQVLSQPWLDEDEPAY